jgi:peptide/nickel transport system permease protein
LLVFALRRSLQALPVVFISTIAVFALLRLLPGDTAVFLAGPNGTPEVVAQIRQNLGLDQPLHVQYLIWLNDIVHGNFGSSAMNGRPILAMLQARVPASLELILSAMALSIFIALTTGVIAALNYRRRIDWAISSYNSFMMSIPNFWLGILSILLFAVVLGWLPPGSRVADGHQIWASIKSLILPAVALALYSSANLSRFVKANMLEVLYDDYVRTAWAKGLRARAVIVGHALRNAILPVVTIIGLQFTGLLGGSVVIESVFSWPGVSSLMLDAISSRDYAIVQAVLLMLVIINVVVNLITDLSYGVLDPRIRLGSA